METKQIIDSSMDAFDRFVEIADEGYLRYHIQDAIDKEEYELADCYTEALNVKIKQNK